MKSYKFRIYPTKKQTEVLNFTLDHCRYLYNTAIQQRRDVYKSTGKSVSFSFQSAEMPLLKEEFSDYKKIYANILIEVLDRVDKAYKSFFRRIKIKGEKGGFPRFQSKNGYNSFTYSCNQGFWIRNNKVELSKIGLIKTKFHRIIPIDTKVKTCTIKQEGSKWFIIFTCQIPNAPIKKPISSIVGIDLGIKTFAVLSNSIEITNPKYLKQSEKRLKVIQSKYSKGKSKKIRKQLVNLHHKIRNQRADFQHKLSHSLVHTFDLIAYEDLKVKRMIESNPFNLQKHIQDAAWGQFISMLKYKAESAGTYCIAVNPRGTSQRCSRCDRVVQKSLKVRLHTCTSCGFVADWDYNAALNIRKLGINLVDKSLLAEAHIE